jgi:hypothetical protein
MTEATRLAEIPLEDCPVGLFQFGRTIGFKSEYMTQQSNGDFSIDAYVVESGEYFWGGTNNGEDQRALFVTPIDFDRIRELEAAPPISHEQMCQLSRAFNWSASPRISENDELQINEWLKYQIKLRELEAAHGK